MPSRLAHLLATSSAFVQRQVSPSSLLLIERDGHVALDRDAALSRSLASLVGFGEPTKRRERGEGAEEEKLRVKKKKVATKKKKKEKTHRHSHSSFHRSENGFILSRDRSPPLAATKIALLSEALARSFDNRCNRGERSANRASSSAKRTRVTRGRRRRRRVNRVPFPSSSSKLRKLSLASPRISRPMPISARKILSRALPLRKKKSSSGFSRVFRRQQKGRTLSSRRFSTTTLCFSLSLSRP